MNSSSLRVAAVTQCYQERIMLPLWVRHYSRLIGKNNLFILDHGSHPPVEVDKNIHVERIPRLEYLDEWDRIHLFSEWQQKLLQNYDWVICVDTDEFIIPRPSCCNSLKEYLSQRSAQTCRCVGVEVIDLMNKPAIDWSQPILKQRSYGVITSWSCKPSIASVPTSWDPGFHRCKNQSLFTHDLWLFHLKYADQKYLLEHSSIRRAVARSAENIKEGIGSSHLMSEKMTMNVLDKYGARFKEGALDDYLATLPDPNHADSECLAIPEEFIGLL